MTRPPAPTASEAPAKRFGREIAAACRDGAEPAELTLRLTLMDASKIKRDRDLALSDISFSPDGMRFMGVRVVEGGVKSSDLFAGCARAGARARAARAQDPQEGGQGREGAQGRSGRQPRRRVTVRPEGLWT